MIPMNDFRADPPALMQAQIAACERVLRSGWYVLGNEVRRFEQQWAAACRIEHAVGVGNGLDAIEIGLRALRFSPGDEIITTPMTAFASVLAIIRAGLTPVLADIDPQTALLSRESVQRCLTSRTRGVLLVHLYGHLHEPRAWAQWCAGHGLALIEDCAQSHLATADGGCAGSFGAFGAYSFYPTKNLGAPGDAGALVTHGEALAQTARALRNYGQANRYEHTELGMNSRLDEMQAAILTERLEWLERFTTRRREIARRYRSELANPRIRLLAPASAPESDVHHLFVVLCEERDRLAQHLSDCGVASLIHYPIPAHRQPALPDVRVDPQGLPHAERHAATCLSVPCHHNMTDEQVSAVVDALNRFA